MSSLISSSTSSSMSFLAIKDTPAFKEELEKYSYFYEGVSENIIYSHLQKQLPGTFAIIPGELDKTIKILFHMGTSLYYSYTLEYQKTACWRSLSYSTPSGDCIYTGLEFSSLDEVISNLSSEEMKNELPLPLIGEPLRILFSIDTISHPTLHRFEALKLLSQLPAKSAILRASSRGPAHLAVSIIGKETIHGISRECENYLLTFDGTKNVWKLGDLVYPSIVSALSYFREDIATPLLLGVNKKVSFHRREGVDLSGLYSLPLEVQKRELKKLRENIKVERVPLFTLPPIRDSRDLERVLLTIRELGAIQNLPLPEDFQYTIEGTFSILANEEIPDAFKDIYLHGYFHSHLEPLQKVAREIKLESDFCSFFRNEMFSDFTFISAEGDTFPVHRIVLVKESDFFTKLFTSSFKERKHPEVTLEEPSEVLESLLAWIYKRELPNKELFFILAEAAEKYNIMSLKVKLSLELVQLWKENKIEDATLIDLRQRVFYYFTRTLDDLS